MEECYMCKSLSTSKEHVPPKCLFPEGKEFGEDFRKNLITVPSCDQHNSAKSSDDEFLMISLAGIIGNNSIGFRHKFSKVNRAIRRNSKILLEEVFVGEKKIFAIECRNNSFIDCIWGTPNYERLSRCFDRIVRGIYLHHFGEKFFGETRVVLGYLSIKEPSARNFYHFIRDKSEIELRDKQNHGNNPDVFYYQISDRDQFGISLVRFCFYGGINIYASLKPDGTQLPMNLAVELMNKGIKTIFYLGDKKYEIN
ncbi:hypothetical protein [Azospirillum lipoferum]|uniref:hypothetical protein n=1 Tax=Azospirillum lipoferum TaxID=193 RepID=UPI001FCC25AC|nr:hypothetical protein [Azospirillum lipoferum]